MPYIPQSPHWDHAPRPGYKICEIISHHARQSKAEASKLTCNYSESQPQLQRPRRPRFHLPTPLQQQIRRR